jgi:hypothetical protein
MLASRITYCGHALILICDGRCDKAWGYADRPERQLSANEDDTEDLSDGELGLAPVRSPTSENDQHKPVRPGQRHNTWCVRMCERKTTTEDGVDFHLPDYARPVRNQPKPLLCDRCGAPGADVYWRGASGRCRTFLCPACHAAG